MVTTMTLYIIQQDGHNDWFDVSEPVELLVTAEAMLDRFRQDEPGKQFRIATCE